MSEQEDKIKARVKKLLNLASDPGAFKGEVDNALRAARELMLKHNISESDLSKEEQAARVKYHQAPARSYGANISLWEDWLMMAVRDLVGTVECYKTNKQVQRRAADGTLLRDIYKAPWMCTVVVFYGPDEDAMDAAALFEEWSEVVAMMARAKYNGAFKGIGRSYAEGFVAGMLATVKALKAAEVKEIAAGSSRALVVLGATELMAAKRTEAKNWLTKEQGITLKTVKRSVNKNDDRAFGSGYQDGKSSEFSRERKLRIGSAK